ncbi:MAG: hypothetical protein AB7F65_03495 [Dehalococcoidia bacterium]
MRPSRSVARFGGPLLLGCVAAMALAFGACGGDGSDATAEPTETPTPTQVIQAASPADLASYRYDLTVSILTSLLDTSQAPSGLPLDGEIRLAVQGERVNPDREHSVASADLGFLQVNTEAIVIGERRWLREPDGTWREGATSPLEAFAGLDFRPSVLFADDAGQYDEIARRLNEYEWVEEDLFGIPTRHFTLDEDAFISLFESEEDILPMELDATLTAEIWLERDLGTPVQLRVVGVDADGAEVIRLDLGLRDLNAEDIAVTPPE